MARLDSQGLVDARRAESEMTVANFRKIVWAHYKKCGRHDLPWRPPTLKLRRGKENEFVYKILVSEVMLQQTQVDRVIPFYKAFIKKFPTAKKLAAAPLSEVLKCWQGLGYNRRAKLLREAAQQLVRTPLSGARVTLAQKLEELPGVGPYTARAVAAFAFNQDVVVIETNIRTAVIHHFFNKKRNTIIYDSVSDAQIQEILMKALPKGKSLLRQGYEGRAREWYSALMDYGAYLKRSGISHNAKSKTYAKQSKFTGSLREARGAILRALASKKKYQGEALLGVLGVGRRIQIADALGALLSEGLITKHGRNYALAD